jgi:NAD(P)-dependent dehydrogenase (short-subunit alcohol dehydrogenase family)
VEPDVFRRQMELNYLGSLNAARAVLPGMVARERGHLVLLSSVSGLIGVFGYGAYTPTKFAVRGLGEAIDGEFRNPRDRDVRCLPTGHRHPGSPPREPQQASRDGPSLRRDRTDLGRTGGRLGRSRQSRLICRFGDLHGPLVRAAMRWRLRSSPRRRRLTARKP